MRQHEENSTIVEKAKYKTIESFESELSKVLTRGHVQSRDVILSDRYTANTKDCTVKTSTVS